MNLKAILKMVLLEDNFENLARFIAGFTAAYEVLGVSCPILYDRKQRQGLIDVDLVAWVIGQIAQKLEANENDMKNANNYLVALYDDGWRLGKTLERFVEELANVAKQSEAGETSTSESDEEPKGSIIAEETAITEEAPSEDRLTEEEIRHLWNRVNTPVSEVMQGPVTSKDTPVSKGPSSSDITYQQLFLYRRKGSTEDYLSEEELKLFPADHRWLYIGVWVIKVIKGDQCKLYDEDLHPDQYAVMCDLMRKAEAPKTEAVKEA